MESTTSADQQLELSDLAPSFRVLRRIVADSDFNREAYVVLVTHVLPTAVEYVRLLASSLAVRVVAVPYTVDVPSVERIRRRGIDVVVPESIEELPGEAIRLMNDAGSMPVVIQEVGGYLAPHHRQLERIGPPRGVVEDTSNGEWRYSSVADELTFPVLSIASSPLKRMEDRSVGRAIAFSVEHVMRRWFAEPLSSRRIAIFGYGRVGAACADALSRREACVTVVDPDPLKRMQASVDGFVVQTPRDAATSSEIVLGTSGRLSIDRDVLQNLPDGAVIFSGSSRQVEIDLEHLRRGYGEVRSDVGGEQAFQTYELNGRALHVANDGFPINFRDYSVLGPSLDGVYSELFLCIREILRTSQEPGLWQSPSSIHREVASIWLEEYAR